MKEIIVKNFTNINNINYTNNNTNNTNFNLCEITKQKEEMTSPSGRSGLASLSWGGQVVGEVNSPSVLLPEQWRGVKLDLFDNNLRSNDQPSYKLKIGVIRQDKTTQALVANLNSPPNYVWRGVEDVDRARPHWRLVHSIMRVLDNNSQPYRVSKCILQGRSGSSEIVVFFLPLDLYQFIIVRNACQYIFEIAKDHKLTQAQRSKNIIASQFFGRNQAPLLTAEELGI